MGGELCHRFLGAVFCGSRRDSRGAILRFEVAGYRAPLSLSMALISKLYGCNVYWYFAAGPALVWVTAFDAGHGRGSAPTVMGAECTDREVSPAICDRLSPFFMGNSC